MAFSTTRKDENTISPIDSPLPAHSESTIGDSLSIEGEIHADEPLVIRGRIKGNVHVNQQLVIAESGQVNGDLYGKVIIIRGTVKGKVVSAQKLIITGSGTFHGDIAAEKLVIEEGARFKGHVTMDSQQPPQPQKTAAAKPAEKSPAKPER